MTEDELLRGSFVSLEVNDTFSEATLIMRDGSRLCFCHRVGERWAKAIVAEQSEQKANLADAALATVSRFRLNAKHLEIQFDDGSRWEARFNRG